jgi:hypothetical protein
LREGRDDHAGVRPTTIAAEDSGDGLDGTGVTHLTGDRQSLRPETRAGILEVPRRLGPGLTFGPRRAWAAVVLRDDQMERARPLVQLLAHRLEPFRASERRVSDEEITTPGRASFSRLRNEMRRLPAWA